MPRDLPGTGSKTYAFGVPGTIESPFLPAGRRSVACPAICREPAAKPVHTGNQAQPNRRFCPQGVGARLPAICREPAAKPMHAGCQAQLSRLVLPGVRRSVACPAICREPAAKPMHAECQAQSSRRFCPEGVGARLPAICREPAAKPVHTGNQAQPNRRFCPQGVGAWLVPRSAGNRQQNQSPCSFQAGLNPNVFVGPF